VKKIICIFGFFIFLTYVKGVFRPYEMGLIGAFPAAGGEAETALADDLTAVYYNPAGIVQITNVVIHYTLGANFIIRQDPAELFGGERIRKLSFTESSLLGVAFPIRKGRIGFAFSGFLVYQNLASKESPVEMYRIGPTVSFLVGYRAFLGLGAGILIAGNRKLRKTGIGASLEAGLIYRIQERLRLGFSANIPTVVTWPNGYGSEGSLKEKPPLRISLGFSYAVSPNFFVLLDFEYQSWDRVRWAPDNKSDDPELEGGFGKTIIPHLGFDYVHQKTGLRARVGYMARPLTEVTITTKLKTSVQHLLTMGIEARTAGGIFARAAFIDSFLLGLIFKNERIQERIIISVEYRFQ